MRRRRWISRALVAILLLLGLGSLATWRKIKPPEVTAFYDAPADIPQEPGSLIRWESIESPTSGRVWRILYTSHDINDQPIAVSGTLALPDGDTPEGGYPVVASAHGMVGGARNCAPSLGLAKEMEGQSIWSTEVEPYLDAGYAVVMSDYQGAGAVGPASNVVGIVEAHNILDGVRAAREFPDIELSDETVLWGHSQGGHAALFANALAPSYAPDVVFTATAVLAPAVDLRGIFTELTSSSKAESRTILALIVAHSWTATYPGQTLEAVLSPAGVAAVNTAVDNLCLPWVGLPAIAIPADKLIKPGAVEMWSPLIDENTPGAQPMQSPLFIGHGEADDVIPIAGTEQYVKDLCAAGNAVEFHSYPGATHFSVVGDATQAILDFYAAVRAGQSASSSCG